MPINGGAALQTAAANEQHYELPTEYFLAALGPHRKYSSCLYERPGASLEEAEVAMLEVCCQRAQLEDGQQVKWGGGHLPACLPALPCLAPAAAMPAWQDPSHSTAAACRALRTLLEPSSLRLPACLSAICQPSLPYCPPPPPPLPGAGAGVRVGQLEPVHGGKIPRLLHHRGQQQPHPARIHHG